MLDGSIESKWLNFTGNGIVLKQRTSHECKQHNLRAINAV